MDVRRLYFIIYAENMFWIPGPSASRIFHLYQLIPAYSSLPHIRYKMIEKIKTAFSVFLILLLFPYIVVMLSGSQTEETLLAAKGDRIDGLDAWVMRILPGEMPVTYELEALKAQAVIARSNLAWRMEAEGIGPEQISEERLEIWEMACYMPEELEELWGNKHFEEYYEKITWAVQETSGKVLSYEGKYVDLPFHAVSAGQTRDGSLLGEAYPYLKAVECPGDLEAEGYLGVVRLQTEDVPEILETDASGYVTEIRLGGKGMAGEEFRHREALNSSCFTIQETKNGWVATTKGVGHGFGLSMYQAHVQAFQGKTFLEILQYFYEGMECISFS